LIQRSQFINLVWLAHLQETSASQSFKPDC
jgi:hypothetical protein